MSARFDLLAGSSGGGSFDRHYTVMRGGNRMHAMMLVAPVTVRAPLSGLAGSLTLECLATPVFNVGDGMRMDVLLEDGGGERMLYTRYFDASRRAEDRAWIPLSIPLELRDSSKCALKIRLSAGPQGDLVADWLALASLRVVQRTISR